VARCSSGVRKAAAVVGTIAFSFVAPAAVGGWLPWLFPHGAFPPAATWRWLGILPVASGAALYVWCAVEFARGLGTPLPGADTEHLVARGPYTVVRNPMYVGVLSAIAGWAIVLASWPTAIYGAAVGLVMHSFVVLVEEPRLSRRFGDGYAAYRSRVRRWRPGVPPTGH
jgi:protein-S-isoprenylcysteine O-methyltransferase Ste14